MNKLIYTEYANLTPYNIKWLDECGANRGYGTSLKDYPPSNTYLFFSGLHVDKFSQSARITEQQSDYTQLTTGDAFCQGVAEILGIEYVPENPLTRKLINKLELHDRMERPLREEDFSGKYKAPEIFLKRICIKRDLLRNDQKACDWLDTTPIRWNNKLNFIFSQWNGCDATHIGFDSNSFSHIYGNDKKNFVEVETVEEFCEYVSECSGVPISKTETVTEDKGLAIDVKLLSEENKNYIESIRDHKWEWNNWKYCAFTKNRSVYATDSPSDENIDRIPITTDPTEFMRYVADKTGKEWKPKEKNMGEGALTNEDVMALLGDKVGYGSYKAYRVLDSLASVPFDTRIPLSEWVPPIEERVCFIWAELFYVGCFVEINSEGFWIQQDNGKGTNVNLDGHWMRIV